MTILTKNKPPASILILDDSQVIRSLLQLTLSKAGYKVDASQNLQEAAEKVAQKTYDLWILDYRLDDNSTGFDLVTQMQLKNLSIPPVFMLSAEESNSHKPIAKSLGINIWVRKPFCPNSILKLVAQVLDT